MFNLGIPSSSSVYVLLFFFFAIEVEDFVFCCLGGCSFDFFDTRDFELSEREDLSLLEEVGLLGPLETCFERTVFVGAIP